MEIAGPLEPGVGADWARGGGAVCQSGLRTRAPLMARLGALAPLALVSSLLLVSAALLLNRDPASGVLSLLGVGTAMIGGLLEYYYILLASSLEELSIRGRVTVASILNASLVVGLYVALIGIILAFRRAARMVEALREAPISSSSCSNAYRPFLGVATLGLLLAIFQSCAAREAERAIREACQPYIAPESLEDARGSGGEDTASGLSPVGP